MRKRGWVLMMLAMGAFLLAGGAGALGQPTEPPAKDYAYRNGKVIIGGDVVVPCRLFDLEEKRDFFPEAARLSRGVLGSAEEVWGSASAMDGRAHFLLVGTEPPYEQGLREASRDERGVRLRSYDALDGETFGSIMRLSDGFSKHSGE